MNSILAVVTGTLMSAVWLVPAALAQTACVTQNMAVPAGANTSDHAAPFFIDTTGLDFSTKPPTRDPNNPNYPRATELSAGALPPAGAEGNFINGPTHAPAPETVAKDGVPKGTTISFTISSKESVIYNPGLIRDDVAGCGNSSIMIATTAPGDRSNMIVTTSHPGTWTRTIDVYVPPNYVRGAEAPFIVLRDGAWEYHSPWAGPAGPNLTVKAGVLTPSEAPGAPLIPSAPTKPIRYWFEMGDQDLFYPNPTIPDGMHDLTQSSELMAKVLAAKGYHYQFLFARNAKNVARPTVAQTLPAALEWTWKGYPIP